MLVPRGRSLVQMQVDSFDTTRCAGSFLLVDVYACDCVTNGFYLLFPCDVESTAKASLAAMPCELMTQLSLQCLLHVFSIFSVRSVFALF